MAPFTATEQGSQTSLALADVAHDLGKEGKDGDEGNDDVWVDAEEEAVDDWEDALDKGSVIGDSNFRGEWGKLSHQVSWATPLNSTKKSRRKDVDVLYCLVI